MFCSDGIAQFAVAETKERADTLRLSTRILPFVHSSHLIRSLLSSLLVSCCSTSISGQWGGRRPRPPIAGDYSAGQGQRLFVGPPPSGATPEQGDMTLYRPPQVSGQTYKEAEAASSFRIFEAIQALRDGKLPTNEQLLRLIDQVVESDTLERKKREMSEDGSKFVDDLISFLGATKRVVEEKNGDEDIQEVRLGSDSELCEQQLSY